MAARSKQDRRKKTASAQKSPPQTENMLQGGAEARTAASSLTKAPAGGRRGRSGPLDGTVRKSSCCLAAVLCLLAGIWLGTLLPALRAAEDLPQSRPRQASVQAEQAEQAEQDKAADSPIRRLEERVGKNPQDMQAWIQLGNLYFDGNKPRDAIRAYEGALAVNGDNPDVLTDMGIMHRQLGEFERATEKFTRASKINPRHEQSRFNLGVVLFFDLNRKDEARGVWRSLVNINPEARTPDGALLRIMLDELQ